MASSSAAPEGLPKKKKEKMFKPSEEEEKDIEDTLEEEEKLPPADTKVRRTGARATPTVPWIC